MLPILIERLDQGSRLVAVTFADQSQHSAGLATGIPGCAADFSKFLCDDIDFFIGHLSSLVGYWVAWLMRSWS